MLKSLLGAFSQNAPVELMKKISNKFFSRETNHNKFGVIFASIAFQSMSILAIRCKDDRKHFQCLNVVSANNKTGSLLLEFD